METWHDTWLRSVGTTTEVQGTGLPHSDPAEVGIFKFAAVIWVNSLYNCWAGLESCVTLVRLLDLGRMWPYDFCDLGDAVWPWTCATLGHAVWPGCVWPWECVWPRTCCLYSTHMVHVHIMKPILCLILYLTSGPILQAEGCSSHMFNLCHSQDSTRPCVLLSFCIHIPV